MIKKLVLFLLLMHILNSTYGQIGLRLGVNIVTQSIKSDLLLLPDVTPLTSFQVGVFYETPISDALSLRPSLLYSIKGSKSSFFTQSIDSKFQYLELPVDFVYRFVVGTTAIPVHMGPYLGYLLRVKEGEEVRTGDELDTFNSLDFGLNLGLGMELEDGSIVIAMNYGLGLAKVLENSDVTSVANRNFSLFAGYKF